MKIEFELDGRAEQIIESVAARLGLTVEEFVLQTTKEKVRAEWVAARPERMERVRAFRAKYPPRPGSLDEFLREKHEEAERERLKDEARGQQREAVAA